MMEMSENLKEKLSRRIVEFISLGKYRSVFAFPSDLQITRQQNEIFGLCTECGTVWVRIGCGVYFAIGRHFL